jgi:hypothetical protein
VGAVAAAGCGRAVVVEQWRLRARMAIKGASGPSRWPRSEAARIDTFAPRFEAAWIHRRPDLAAVVAAMTSGRWLRQHPEQRCGGVRLEASAVGRRLEDMEHMWHGELVRRRIDSMRPRSRSTLSNNGVDLGGGGGSTPSGGGSSSRWIDLEHFFSFFVSGNVTFRWLDQVDEKYGTFVGADGKYGTFIEKLLSASGRQKFLCFL